MYRKRYDTFVPCYIVQSFAPTCCNRQITQLIHFMASCLYCNMTLRSVYCMLLRSFLCTSCYITFFTLEGIASLEPCSFAFISREQE